MSDIAVVIPAYKVTRHILPLIERIGPEVRHILVVDDACPDASGKLVADKCKDRRVRVLHNEKNLGVGGAVMAGYRAAVELGASVIIKLDGDGQMDPALIPVFAASILEGRADYAKGNRFFDVESMRSMPAVRLIGNIGLSFLSKMSSGYWNLLDPTNGYTAIHGGVAAILPYDKIANRYFFETDMLFRLGIVRAVVTDIPMIAVYADEESSMNVMAEVPRFLGKNLRNTFKRFVYNYIVRNFGFATIELVFGLAMLLFGLVYGGTAWIENMRLGQATNPGTVMVAGGSVIVGLQLLLGFINYDMSSQPTTPLAQRLHLDGRRLGKAAAPRPRKKA